MTPDIFCRILIKACGVAPGAHILAAVSGGADSVAMLCLLEQAREKLGLRISCAHVEHGIRGEASVRDMDFVRDLCRKKNIAFYETRVNAVSFAEENGCGVEDAARRLRYAFLKETQKRIGAQMIAVAHHAGDQAETVLMHAARGSDLRGLCAMRMVSGDVIRPLLGAGNAELREYLRSIGQAWCEDETNQDTDYARNAVRHCVLPQLVRAYPGAENALAHLALCAQRDEAFFAQQIQALDLQMIPLADGAAVEIASIRGLHDALLSRVLVRFVEMAGAQISAFVIDSLMRALRNGDAAAAVGIGYVGGEYVHARMGERFLCVTRPYQEIGETYLQMGETTTPFGTFFVRLAQAWETGDGVSAQTMPKALLEGARVTARREGDAMVPFGRHSPVKLKKLMIDAGVERAMRRSVPVIRKGKEILWVPGLRPSNACRAGEGEERVMIVFRAPECVKIQ